MATWGLFMETSNKSSLFSALAEASFVKSVTYILVIISPPVGMMWWFAAYAPINTTDAATVSAGQASEIKTLPACACSSTKEHFEK